MRGIWRLRATLLLLVIAIVAASCSGDDGNALDAADTPSSGQATTTVREQDGPTAGSDADDDAAAEGNPTVVFDVSREDGYTYSIAVKLVELLEDVAGAPPGRKYLYPRIHWTVTNTTADRDLHLLGAGRIQVLTHRDACPAELFSGEMFEDFCVTDAEQAAAPEEGAVLPPNGVVAGDYPGPQTGVQVPIDVPEAFEDSASIVFCWAGQASDTEVSPWCWSPFGAPMPAYGVEYGSRFE